VDVDEEGASPLAIIGYTIEWAHLTY